MLQHISVDHLPDSHLRGIGLVAVSWAYLEGAVERIIWSLARLSSNRGECATTHLSVRSRFDIALSLANEEISNTDIPLRLQQYKNYVTNNLARERNNVVHSRLHFDPEWQHPVRGIYKARGKRKRDFVGARLNEYEHISLKIINAANDLIDMLNDINHIVKQSDGTNPPWLDKHM